MICAFCGLAIEETDPIALRLSIENARLTSEAPTIQTLFSHSSCLSHTLDPKVPFDIQLFSEVN